MGSDLWRTPLGALLFTIFKEGPMNTKKTLVARFHIEVTQAPDAVIEAYKTLISHSAKANEAVEKVDFEVLVANKENTLASMLKAVQSEFQAASRALFAEQATDDEVAEAEKSDGFGDFLRLVMGSDEDEEEAEDDDE
jgi:hypothetical protein